MDADRLWLYIFMKRKETLIFSSLISKLTFQLKVHVLLVTPFSHSASIVNSSHSVWVVCIHHERWYVESNFVCFFGLNNCIGVCQIDLYSIRRSTVGCHWWACPVKCDRCAIEEGERQIVDNWNRSYLNNSALLHCFCMGWWLKGKTHQLLVNSDRCCRNQPCSLHSESLFHCYHQPWNWYY